MSKNKPRDMAEIQREAQEAYFQAGLAQYTIQVNEDQLVKLNNKLLDLNHEAASRQKIDKEAGEAPKATVELPSVSE